MYGAQRKIPRKLPCFFPSLLALPAKAPLCELINQENDFYFCSGGKNISEVVRTVVWRIDHKLIVEGKKQTSGACNRSRYVSSGQGLNYA